MKKNLMRTAVAVAAISAGTSALATDKDYTAATSPAAIPIANEAIISAATGTAVGAVTGNLTFDTGFAVSNTASRYMRVDLSSGTWAAAQPAGQVQMGAAAGTTTESLAAGGTTTTSFVIYEVVAASASKASSATTDVIFTPATGITVKDKADVNITYSLYETAGDAVSQTSALATDTGALITFTDVTTVTNTDSTTTAPLIDVTVATKTGKVFAGGLSTGLVGVVNVADTAAIELLDGTAASTSSLTASNVLTVTGDMTFMQDLDTNNSPDGTYTLANAFVDNDNDCAVASTLVGDEAETVTDANMTFTTTAYNNDVLYVCVTANGVTDIPVQAFSGNYSTVGATGYASESTDLTLFSHAKNGSSVTKNLVLNPTGNYKNFLRVSNLSTITGDVSFSLTNDSGTTVNNVLLGSISGQSSSSLAGGNSTSMIDIADLYAAAQALVATFDVGTGKLRVTVSGNFGTMDVQNITTATDNTSFDTF
jgi:hypothetical protein